MKAKDRKLLEDMVRTYGKRAVREELDSIRASNAKPVRVVMAGDAEDIESLGLPIRVYNAIKRTGITSVKDLLTIRNDGKLSNFKNLGAKGIAEVESALRARGLLDE